MEILRQKHEAELNVSNALASIDEAITVLLQNIPDDERAARVWDKQIRKLRLAQGCCANVRAALTVRPEFATLTAPSGEGDKR